MSDLVVTRQGYSGQVQRGQSGCFTPTLSHPAGQGQLLDGLNKERHWLWEHVTKTVVAALMLSALVWILSAAGPWMLGIFGTLFNWLGEPVSVSRWHYWLLALISLSVILLVGLAWSGQQKPEIPHRTYRQDSFFGILWRWEWTAAGHLRESTITPFCAQCDRIIPCAVHFSTTHFRCEHWT